MSKAENASTSYSETGFPVLFHNGLRKNSQHEHSEHTLFKEDTTSSHTEKHQDKDRMPEQPRINIQKNHLDVIKSSASQSPP